MSGHDDGCETPPAGANHFYYFAARRVGATPPEIVEALERGVGTEDYAEARRVGALHRETLELVELGSPDGAVARKAQALLFSSYTRLRKEGWTHAPLLEAHRAGFDLDAYVGLRTHSGAEHAELIALRRAGLGKDGLLSPWMWNLGAWQSLAQALRGAVAQGGDIRVAAEVVACIGPGWKGTAADLAEMAVLFGGSGTAADTGHCA